ncbi:hypothetical protein [Nocardia abscessus]|uniref:hypothetical protein n=1 Tax=Nocardia abscessus TaxID=120957 RepID=UPI002456C645|nr:hypothetical protein [Nocardia abscessus]
MHSSPPLPPPSPSPLLPSPQPPATTAIIAATLAVLGGLRGLLGSFAIPFIESDPEFDPTRFWRKIQLLLIVAVLLATLLLVGGILMYMRKKIARVLLGVGGLGTLTLSIVISIALYNHTAVDGPVSVNPAPTILGLIGMAFNTVMLILTFLPSTSRWLAYQQNRR